MKLGFYVLLLIVSKPSFACDICGGINSNTSIGILASNQFHSIGIRNTHRKYSSFLNGIRHSKELFFTSEINFRIQLNKRFQLIGTVPFQFAQQKRDLGNDTKNGWSDPNLILNTILWHQKDSNEQTKNFLSLGIGTKFPLGKYGLPNESLKNLYPGTGSLDFLIFGTYIHSFNSFWSIQSEVSYSLKGKDAFLYEYGNSSQFSFSGNRNFSLKKHKLISTLSGILDDYEASKINNLIQAGKTNQGTVFSSKIQLNLFANNWIFGTYFQLPLYQAMKENTIKQHFNTGLNVHYLINKKNRK